MTGVAAGGTEVAVGDTVGAGTEVAVGGGVAVAVAVGGAVAVGNGGVVAVGETGVTVAAGSLGVDVAVGTGVLVAVATATAVCVGRGVPVGSVAPLEQAAASSATPVVAARRNGLRVRRRELNSNG